MPPVGVARPRPCPATTPDVRPATRGSSIPPTLRPWKRSSPSCARPATTPTATGSALWWSCSGGGLRVAEALSLGEHDLDTRRGSLLVRNGKGGRRREIGMDAWGWEQLRPWLSARLELPVGPLFCVIDGPTRGRPWSSANVRVEFRRLAAQAGIRRRFAPHQLRHAHAVELARERVPLNVIQRQLGHANLGTTSIYLQGIDTEEIIATVHARRAPMMSATAGLRL
jgi:integrase